MIPAIERILDTASYYEHKSKQPSYRKLGKRQLEHKIDQLKNVTEGEKKLAKKQIGLILDVKG
jgi:hypothetical protein